MSAMLPGFPHFAAISWLLLFSHVGLASNVTSFVDDTSMDPITGHHIQYSPANAWRAVSNGNCTDCAARPDALIAYEQTWHESDLSVSSQGVTPKATFSFFGTCLPLRRWHSQNSSNDCLSILRRIRDGLLHSPILWSGPERSIEHAICPRWRRILGIRHATDHQEQDDLCDYTGIREHVTAQREPYPGYYQRSLGPFKCVRTTPGLHCLLVCF